MFIYNVTVSVENDVADPWLDWMRNHHIRDVLATGYFSKYKLLKLVNETSEASGTTYAIQYFAKSMEDIQQYLENDAQRLRNDHIARFGPKVVAFRTILEEI